jgi:hypothetical protein
MYSNGVIDIPEVVFAKLTPEQLLALSNLPLKVGGKTFVIQSYQKKSSSDNQLGSSNIVSFSSPNSSTSSNYGFFFF